MDKPHGRQYTTENPNPRQLALRPSSRQRPQRLRQALAALFVAATAALALWLWTSPAGLEQAPEATFSIIDGRKIQLRALRDRPVLVTFWATTCPGCIKEMPHLAELYEEFGGQMELIGVAMSYDPPNRVLELVRKRQLPYPVSLDLDGALAGAFGNVMLTPTSFLIAPGGKVVRHKIGEMDMGQLRRQLQTLLRDRERPS